MIQPLGTSAVGTGSVNQVDPRLVHAAHEFEAQMMKELLKPLTAGDALGSEDEDSGSGSGAALSEFASEALGRSLSDHGGLGIANRIVGDLSHVGNQRGANPVTVNLHGNTVMRVPE